MLVCPIAWVSAAMTRLCVKNLPKSIDEARLRKHFSTRGGEVTDVKVLKTKEGKLRRMAFVGYKTDAEAKKAKSYFNGSFLDTSRLVVEEAKPRGDAALARPWSKYSEGSSRHKGPNETGKDKAEGKGEGKGVGKRGRVEGTRSHEPADDSDGDEPEKGEDGKAKRRKIEKEEFLAAMMPRSRTRAWANDDVMSLMPEDAKKQPLKGKGVAGAGMAPVDSDSDDGSDADVNDMVGQDDGQGSVDGEEAGKEGKGPSKRKPAEPSAPEVSGLDWLKSKVKKNLEKEVEKEEKEEDGEGDRMDVVRERGKLEEKEDELEDEGPEETARLFIRNLPFTTSEEEIQEALEEYGAVSEVHMPLDDAKRKKGFAFAQFILPEDAKKAMEAMDGRPFQGRILHVVPAKEPPKDALAELDPSQARTYKERKEIERRQRAGDDRGWNSSFLRSETVVDAVADRLGIDKGAVLDRDSSNMAVRLAVSETTLLAENREFFEKEGVDLRALEGSSNGSKASKRSKTTLLVKNLPYTTTEEDLTKLFGRHGSLARVLLPPSRSIGLVDFLEPSEARRAFKSLAYKRFQHVPLYLEWAPLGIIRPSSATPSAVAAPSVPPTNPAEAASSKAADEGEEEDEGSFTLFVKNLNFNTTEEALRQAFEKRTKGVRTVAIPKKTAPPKKGEEPSSAKQLSMGFGFVEYSSSSAAREALRLMKNVVLDGHTLECKTSSKRLSAPAKVAGPSSKKRTKLIVRNVAFQATVKELKELFGTFGKVKTARIPKKFDNNHRGFAFVEFVTAKEAAHAFEALSATHLYGRHLVIEWAEDKDDLETLRDKAGKDAARAKVSAAAAQAAEGGVFDEE